MQQVYIEPLDVTVSVSNDAVDAVFRNVSPLIPEDWCTRNREGYGYPDDLVKCVTDAIWSIGVKYVEHVIPVLNRLEKYREIANLDLKDPEKFLEHFSDHLNDYGEWLAVEIFANRQKTSTSLSAWRKSYAIQCTLEILRDKGISTPSELLLSIQDKDLRNALQRVPGDSIGVRTDYLFMLAGCDELAKYDRQISRFLGLPFNAKMRLYSIALLTGVAERLREKFPCINTRSVDHFIWVHMSGTSDGFEIINSKEFDKKMNINSIIMSRAEDSSSLSSSSSSDSDAIIEETICHECYLLGLYLYVEGRQDEVSAATCRQYRIDGERFSFAFRNGFIKVKGRNQHIPKKRFLLLKDFELFSIALASGGLKDPGAYRTPIVGAFASASPCSHKSAN
jgi:hypothetical protein